MIQSFPQEPTLAPVADESRSHLVFPDDFVEQDGLFRPARAAASAFDYTDGDAAEAEIHRVIRAAADRSSASFELERGIHDWPTEYHLSRARCNLLRPFDLAEYENALEIGSGCGAITRYLAETCARVTALEGSPNRAAIVRDRCADLGNVTCVCANLDDVRFTEKYDLVVVIGVLEYAGKYLAGRTDPWQYFLRLVLGAMAPGGTCILAIENQLGVKYFGGAAEDHTGRPHEGLEGYYPGTEVRTFGRAELLRCFERAGLNASLFLPFPDYKLPRVILNAASADKGLGLSQWHDRGRDALRFAEPLVLLEAEKNGLLADLANSFVVVATRADEPAPNYTWDAAYYSVNRRRQYQTETRLEEAAGRPIIRKAHLFLCPAEESASLVRQAVGLSPYVPGEKLSLQMLRALRRSDREGEREFRRLVAGWDNFLTCRATGEGQHARLPGDLLDCTPFNLVVTERGLEVIDREWALNGSDVTVGWVLFRGLYWFLVSYWDAVRCRRLSRGEWGPFLEDQFAALGYRLTAAEMRSFVQHEAVFQNAILEGRNLPGLAAEMFTALGPTSALLRLGRSAAFGTRELVGRAYRALRNGGG